MDVEAAILFFFLGFTFGSIFVFWLMEKTMGRKISFKQKIVEFAKKKHQHLINKILLFVSPILFMFTVWQHEILMLEFMAPHWKEPFAFFSGVVTTKGVAYDVTLLFEFVSYIILAIALWTWNDDPNISP
jgi:hypothetical protein